LEQRRLAFRLPLMSASPPISASPPRVCLHGFLAMVACITVPPFLPADMPYTGSVCHLRPGQITSEMLAMSLGRGGGEIGGKGAPPVASQDKILAPSADLQPVAASSLGPSLDKAQRGGKSQKEVLSCCIKGFYPFAGGPKGLTAWLFQDIHQAIIVKSSVSSDKLSMDFMTDGGVGAEVWWNEQLKWQVFLGQSIPGEVRMRNSGTRSAPGSKLERLREIAARYDCSMNLYTNNCRIFCARMQREVERLNHEDADAASSFASELAAESRLAFGILTSVMLPLLYPACIILLIRVCGGF